MSLSNNTKQINISLNFVKFFGILGVICLHCGIYTQGTFGFTIASLSRFAVPIFFLISGFYSYYENKAYAITKYKKRIKKLFILFIISEVFYFILFSLIFKRPEYNLISILDFNSCINYIVFNVSPVGVHLWFIQALLYCYIIYFILGKLNIKYDNLYYLIPILLIIHFILDEFSIFMGFNINSMYFRNFLFMGMPFFILGYYIHDNEYRIKQIFSNEFLLLGIFASLMLIIIESMLTVKQVELYIGTIFFSILLFIYCVNNPFKLNFKLISWIGGNLYTPMYILHLMVIQLFNPILHMEYLNPIIIFFITALISMVPYIIKKYLNNNHNKINSHKIQEKDYSQIKINHNEFSQEQKYPATYSSEYQQDNNQRETPEEMEARIRAKVIKDLQNELMNNKKD